MAIDSNLTLSSTKQELCLSQLWHNAGLQSSAWCRLTAPYVSFHWLMCLLFLLALSLSHHLVTTLFLICRNLSGFKTIYVYEFPYTVRKAEKPYSLPSTSCKPGKPVGNSVWKYRCRFQSLKAWEWETQVSKKINVPAHEVNGIFPSFTYFFIQGLPPFQPPHLWTYIAT